MKLWSGLILVLCLLFTAGLTGCCSIGIGKCIKQDRITIKSANDLNACGKQKESALNIRIYYLEKVDKWESIEDITEFWENDEGVLDQDVLARKNFWIQPGETGVEETLVRPKDAPYIGVVGNYCNPEGICHRFLKLSKGSEKLTLDLQSTELTLERSP